MSEGKKVLVYCRIKHDDPVNKGAVKKYRGLISGFQSLGYKTDIVWQSENGLVINDELIFPFRLSPSMESLRNILFNHVFFDWQIARKIDFTDYHTFFVRYPLSHPAFIWMLKKVKTKNPNLRILLEVPTYPYILEHNSFIRKLQQRMDDLLLPLLKRYVDRTVHYGNFPSLFSIPAVGIGNGVDVAAFPISSSVPQTGVLRLLAVGNWNHWHGLSSPIFQKHSLSFRPSLPLLSQW